MILGGQLLRYLVVGGLAASIEFGAFLILLEAGLPLALATMTSFVIAALVNFVLSARFVFSVSTSARRLGAYLLFATLGLAVNTGVTLLAAHLVGLPPWLAKCTGMGVAFVVNFLCNALIVFLPVQPVPKTRPGE